MICVVIVNRKGGAISFPLYFHTLSPCYFILLGFKFKIICIDTLLRWVTAAALSRSFNLIWRKYTTEPPITMNLRWGLDQIRPYPASLFCAFHEGKITIQSPTLNMSTSEDLQGYNFEGSFQIDSSINN